MMKKITRLALTLALLIAGVGSMNATKVFATYGTPASEGAWDAATSTYTWTKSYSNLMTIFTFPNGELADYRSIHLTTSDYTNVYRIVFMNGGETLATIAFYSAGQKDLVLSERDETKDLDLSKVTHISFGGNSASGSIVLSKAYLQKPFELKIDNAGKAVVSITDLTASGCLSLNEETGELTSTLGEDGAPGWGRLAINLPDSGIDLTNITGFSVQQTGTVLFNNFEIGGKGFWSNVMGRSDLGNYITDSAVGDPTAVNTWRWNVGSAGTQTIQSVTLQFSVLTASDPHLTPLTAAQFNDSYCEYHIGESMGQGSTIFGNGSVLADKYADLSGYDELRITGTPGQAVRLLFNWGTTQNEVIQTLDAEGYTAIDLMSLPAQQLNAFKFQWDGKTATITSMQLYKASVPTAYSYVMSGSGEMTPSVLAALADATATSIDATGVTKATELTTANPNCLIIADAGIIANTQNVIVDGVCANLVLTDQKPFCAPEAFTATNATLEKTVSSAEYATMVLPFDVATLPTGVEAYDIESVAGSVLTTNEVTAIAANKPVLLKNAGTYSFTAASAAIAATPAEPQQNGLLYGVYSTTDVPTTNGYVLQNQSGEVSFYKSVEGMKTDAFRAYLATTASTRLKLDLNGETTGIAATKLQKSATEVYNLKGQRVAQPLKGLYIVDGKKVMVK